VPELAGRDLSRVDLMESDQPWLAATRIARIPEPAGVLTLLVNPQHGVVGSLQTSLDLSYLADTVLLLRFYEPEGRIREGLSVIKHRGGPHEDRIREYRIGTHGLRVGEPLTMFRGVLTGTPAYTGDIDPLLEGRGYVSASRGLKPKSVRPPRKSIRMPNVRPITGHQFPAPRSPLVSLPNDR
jgi:hypothetical protein